MSNPKWKNEKIFSSYEEAIEYKTTLLNSPEGATLEVKIKSYKEKYFVVKSRTHPELEYIIQKLDEELAINKNKKG